MIGSADPTHGVSRSICVCGRLFTLSLFTKCDRVVLDRFQYSFFPLGHLVRRSCFERKQICICAGTCFPFRPSSLCMLPETGGLAIFSPWAGRACIMPDMSFLAPFVSPSAADVHHIRRRAPRGQFSPSVWVLSFLRPAFGIRYFIVLRSTVVRLEPSAATFHIRSRRKPVPAPYVLQPPYWLFADRGFPHARPGVGET